MSGVSGDFAWKIHINGDDFRGFLERKSTGYSYDFTVPSTFYSVAKDLHLPIDDRTFAKLVVLVINRINDSKAEAESKFTEGFFR